MVGTVFVLSAPSGTGKTSLVSALLERMDDLFVSISYTTRTPRHNECEGKEYFFVAEHDFVAMQQSGAFLESAQVFGNYYGTSIQWVEKQVQKGRDVLLELDWQGALQVRKHFPDAVLVFVAPPSLQTLQERLDRRGSNTEDDMAVRLAGARHEIMQAEHYDYIVVNADFDLALTQLQSVIDAARLQINRQSDLLSALLAS